MSVAMNLGMNLPSADISGFDPDFYLRLYPDVASSGMDPKQHYINYGMKEGRVANEAQWNASQGGQSGALSAADQKSVDAYAKNPYGFDPNFYLKERPDVAKANVDPFQHYQQFGMKEGTPRNAYAATYGLPGAGQNGEAAPPPPTAPTLDPTNPASWAAWKQQAAAQTQGLNRMPGVAPSTASLSADPLAVRAQFYPNANNAATQYTGQPAASATDPTQMTPAQMQQMMINLGMKL